MKKSAGTKGKKATGIVMATRATLELHRSAVSAAKTAGESLGDLMLRGIALAIAKKVMAPKKATVKLSAVRARTRTPKTKKASTVPAADVAPESEK